jgi:hypothetical protein
MHFSKACVLRALRLELACTTDCYRQLSLPLIINRASEHSSTKVTSETREGFMPVEHTKTDCEVFLETCQSRVVIGRAADIRVLSAPISR